MISGVESRPSLSLSWRVASWLGNTKPCPHLSLQVSQHARLPEQRLVREVMQPGLAVGLHERAGAPEQNEQVCALLPCGCKEGAL